MRLTNAMRRSILDKLESRYVCPEIDRPTIEELKDFGDRLYALTYKGREKEVELASQLGKEWLVFRTKLEILAITTLEDGSNFYKRTMVLLSEPKPILDKHRFAWELRADHPMIDEAQALIERSIAEEELKRKAMREASDIVRACTTDKGLIQAWPEIEAVVREVCIPPEVAAKQLPTTTRASLNANFKLPPDDEKQAA